MCVRNTLPTEYLTKKVKKFTMESETIEQFHKNNMYYVRYKIPERVNKVSGFFRLVALLKETPTKFFSCEYCEISTNSYFEEHLRTTTSVICNKNSK